MKSSECIIIVSIISFFFLPWQHRQQIKCDYNRGKASELKEGDCNVSRYIRAPQERDCENSTASYYITSEGMLEHCRHGLLDDLTNTRTFPE